MSGPGQGFDFDCHQPLGSKCQQFAHEIGIGRLLDQLE
jgi:hypothetical protein